MTKEREQKYERIELTPLRLAIANRMTESKTTIPHAATKIGIDVTALVRVRSVLKNQWINEKGFCPTPFAFTVNNTGAYGSEDGYAVIMPPQAAILTVRKIAKTPVVTEEGGEERIVVRSIMPISLSFDHRIMDGKEATGYLLNIRELIEKGGCFDALE